jgi:hypothetical protein
MTIHASAPEYSAAPVPANTATSPTAPGSAHLLQEWYRQGQLLQATLLDELAQRAIRAETWITQMDQTTRRWWDHLEQMASIPTEPFLRQCGMATRTDLQALAHTLAQIDLQLVDLSDKLTRKR